MTLAEAAWAARRYREFLRLTAGGTDLELRVRRAEALRHLGRRVEADPALLAEAEVHGGRLLLRALHLSVLAARGDTRELIERAIGLARELGDLDRVAALQVVRADKVLGEGDTRLVEALLAEVDGGRDRPDWCLIGGQLAHHKDDLPVARELFRRAEALADAVGVEAVEVGARAAFLLGAVATVDGDLVSARAAFMRAVDLLERHDLAGFTRALAWNGLGECARAEGDLDGAAVRYRAAIREAQASGRESDAFHANLGLVELERGRFDEARAWLEPLGRSGSRVLETIHALANVVAAACQRDGTAFDLAFRPFLSGWADVNGEPDIARLASRAARVAEDNGWRVRAVRARRVAVGAWRRVGRHREADEEDEGLLRLAGLGVPTPLGPFLLGPRIAKGAFGVVRGAHDGAGLRVAIKVLDPAATSASLDRELRAVAGLDHPNVVRLLHHGRVDRTAARMDRTLPEGAPWIAMELAEGTIEPHLGRWSWPEIQRALVAVLDVLAHAHARGLLHLDVKPANVLLCGGVPKLADFGLAAAIGSDVRPGGTPAYTSPEQFTGTGLGPWTDLYAVGCLAGALVSGAPPFAGETFAELQLAHRVGQPAVRPAVPVPAGFLPWVRRLLAKQPRDRFRRAADAARALMSLGEAAGVGEVRERPAVSGDLPTVVLPPGDDRPHDDRPLGTVVGELAAIPRPALPLGWARPHLPPPPMSEAALGLFGLRSHPFVGRDKERSLLWATLHDVVRRGTVRGVVIEAPAGTGASALGAWLCERAHEVGAATPVVLRAGEGAAALAATGRDRPIVLWADDAARDPVLVAAVDTALARERSLLLVVTAHPGEVPDRWLDDDRCGSLTLGPLAPAEQRALFSSLLPLAPEALDALVNATGGHPRFAVQLLTDLVSRGRLEPGPDGARFRQAPVLPASLADLWPDRLRAALAEVGTDARRCLRVAAALEPFVDAREWEAACGEAFDDDGARALLDARLAVPRRDGWAFVDPAIRALLAR